MEINYPLTSPGQMAQAMFAFLGRGPNLRGGAVIAILAGGPTTMSGNTGKMGHNCHSHRGGPSLRGGVFIVEKKVGHLMPGGGGW